MTLLNSSCEVAKKYGKPAWNLKFLVADKFGIYLVYF